MITITTRCTCKQKGLTIYTTVFWRYFCYYFISLQYTAAIDPSEFSNEARDRKGWNRKGIGIERERCTNYCIYKTRMYESISRQRFDRRHAKLTEHCTMGKRNKLKNKCYTNTAHTWTESDISRGHAMQPRGAPSYDSGLFQLSFRPHACGTDG